MTRCRTATMGLFVLLPSVLPAADTPTSVARPNFVIFYTDDQPYLGMSYTGKPVLETPHMDRLAKEGVFFEKAFVTTAICCSSRASILTGQHMCRHGIKDFRTPLSAAQWQQTFPALLRKAGYQTAYLGKFAIGSPGVDPALALPADQFDLWYGFPQSIAFKQEEKGETRYLTTVMTEKAVDFLETAKPDQPFCLIMALKEPHGPLTYFDPEFPDRYVEADIPRPENLTRESFDALPETVRKSLGSSQKWIDNNESYQQYMRQIYAYISRSDLVAGSGPSRNPSPSSGTL